MDERLRELERRWRSTGDAEDEAAWLAELARVEPERVRLAALLGAPDGLPASAELTGWPRPALARVALALAEAARDAVVGPHHPVTALLLGAARAWCDLPGPAAAGLVEQALLALRAPAPTPTLLPPARVGHARMAAAAACRVIVREPVLALAAVDGYARLVAPRAALMAALARDVVPWVLAGSACWTPEPTVAELLATWSGSGDPIDGAAWLVRRRAEQAEDAAKDALLELAAVLGEPAAEIALGRVAPSVSDPRLWPLRDAAIAVRMAIGAARLAVPRAPEVAPAVAAAETWLDCPCEAHRAALRAARRALVARGAAVPLAVRCVREATRWCRPSLEPEPEDDGCIRHVVSHGARVAAAMAPLADDAEETVLDHDLSAIAAARNATAQAIELVGLDGVRATLRVQLVPWLLGLR